MLLWPRAWPSEVLHAAWLLNSMPFIPDHELYKTNIHSTKRCKSMTLASILIQAISTLLIFIQWRNGFKLWDGIYLFPFGVATGMLFPALFVGMATYAPEGKLHVCIGTYYLCQQLGLIIGPAAGSALNQKLFAARLGTNLGGLKDKSAVSTLPV